MNFSEKIELLNQVKSSLMKEIYKKCIESGINPDTFDYKLYANSTNEPVVQGSLAAHCYKLVVVNQKIQELQ